MKNAMKKIGNSLDAMNRKLEKAEEWITDLEDKIIESNKAEQKTELCKTRIDLELRDSIKHGNICIIGVSEKDREKGA